MAVHVGSCRALRVDGLVNKAELGRHRGREDKGVEVRQLQAAAQAVQREGQRQGTVNLVVSRLAELGQAG